MCVYELFPNWVCMCAHTPEGMCCNLCSLLMSLVVHNIVYPELWVSRKFLFLYFLNTLYKTDTHTHLATFKSLENMNIKNRNLVFIWRLLLCVYKNLSVTSISLCQRGRCVWCPLRCSCLLMWLWVCSPCLMLGLDFLALPHMETLYGWLWETHTHPI